ncbi:DNAH5 [Cordylochernes scorpioides]|uniref:DNAH5 n=1 Tax=Cordylochernes scorpioides TaxID=51811 RepID=A0ABY6L5A8_9ARAC|nr:DNAH5 [Cordylochernes scorpioides]
MFSGSLVSTAPAVFTNIYKLLGDVYLPLCHRVDENAEPRLAEQLSYSLDCLVEALRVARSSLARDVVLKTCPLAAGLEDMEDVAARHPEVVKEVEECLRQWCEQVEQLLAECSHLRRESEDMGPRSELEYWKCRRAKFGHLIDQMKGSEIQALLKILKTTKCKALKQWNIVEKKLIQAWNESKDCVKYLETLDQYCQPLHSADPVRTPQDPELVEGLNLDDFQIFLDTDQLEETLRTSISASNVPLILFWDQHGVFLEDYTERGTMLNPESYSCLWKHGLKMKLKMSKRIGLLSKRVILIHNKAIARYQTTDQTLQDIDFEVIPHPTYSSVLLPCYC